MIVKKRRINQKAPISYVKDYDDEKVKEMKIKEMVSGDTKEIKTHMTNGDSNELLFECIKEYIEIVCPMLGWSNDTKHYTTFIKILYGNDQDNWKDSKNGYNTWTCALKDFKPKYIVQKVR